MKKYQVFLLIIILVGCSSNQTDVSSTPRVAQPTSPPVSATIPPSTPSPTPTPTPEPTRTSRPAWTPLPTFVPASGMETLQTWLQGTFDCLLPCWGGITPGKTTWQEARQSLERMSGFSTVNIAENMSCEFGGCQGIAWSLYPQTVAEGVFYTKLPRETIHVISINLQNEGTEKTNLLRNLRLEGVFQWYGPPDILLLNAMPDTSGDSFLELVMVYSERQFIIRYVKIAEIQGDQVVSCGQDHQIQLTVLDNSAQLASLEAIANAVETRDFQISAPRKSVEEATGMTLQTFYVAFSTNRKEPCISTPVDIWLQ